VVTAITPIQVEAKGSGAGAVAGGVAGIVVGNQIGGGSGKTIAKILGAAGGAYAGNMAEKKLRAETQYQIRVHFDNGGETTITQATLPAVGVGSAVRVVDGAVIPK
jgi:outer membrane lipoprotein SlyB